MVSKLFDASHYNQTVDFGVAKANGYAGAYLKATEGATYVDPTFNGRPALNDQPAIPNRRAEAKAAGLPVGAYLFFHPSQDVQAQVDLFVRTVGHTDLRVALDYEVTDGLNAADAATKARQALVLLTKKFGYAPLLYTYPAFIPNCNGLQGFPLWIADYAKGATAPRFAPWLDWVLWQTGQENVPGVSAGDGPDTDVNVAPSFARLVVPPAIPATPTVKEPGELTPQDWKDMGALIDKCITHVRNGTDYNLGTMAAELAQIKADVAAIKAKG